MQFKWKIIKQSISDPEMSLVLFLVLERFVRVELSSRIASGDTLWCASALGGKGAGKKNVGKLAACVH